MYYVTCYKKPEFGDLIESTDNLTKQHNQLKKEFPYSQGTKKRQQEKLIKVQDEKLKDYHRQMAGWVNQYNLYFGIFNVALVFAINSFLSGIVVAKLPF